jgi:hypothetical protein
LLALGTGYGDPTELVLITSDPVDVTASFAGPILAKGASCFALRLEFVNSACHSLCSRLIVADGVSEVFSIIPNCVPVTLYTHPARFGRDIDDLVHLTLHYAKTMLRMIANQSIGKFLVKIFNLLRAKSVDMRNCITVFEQLLTGYLATTDVVSFDLCPDTWLTVTSSTDLFKSGFKSFDLYGGHCFSCCGGVTL